MDFERDPKRGKGLSPPMNKDGKFINIATGLPYTDDELRKAYKELGDECNPWIVEYLESLE